jgi:WD40 repeat protein/serine/threonine protein kinase
MDVLLDDQRRRWLGGERVRVTDYLAQQPALRERPEAILDLICHEIILRKEQGEAPQLEDYLAPFPQFASELRCQFEVFRAIQASHLTGATVISAAGAGPRPGRLPDADEAAPVSVPGYEILGEVARGGMGVVYKARHVQLNRLVALKMVLAGGHAGAVDLARSRTEAEAVARLQHPNIVQIFEVGEHAGLPYLALEFCPGGSLADKLNGTPLPPTEAARLVEILARAMEVAHRNAIIHRDLKPANVLLAVSDQHSAVSPHRDASGAELKADRWLLTATPKITDFGLAKKLDSGSGQTASGAILGTPSYMAPEQAGGHSKEVGPQADVYALGAILYELLTGRPPFKAATAMDTLLLVLSEEPVPPRALQPKLPRDLETICLKCLHKEAKRRYASAADLADDLRRFGASEPIQARPVGRWERGVKWARRRPAVAALLAALMLAALGMVVGGAWFTLRLNNALATTEDQRDQAVQARRASDASAEAEKVAKENAQAAQKHAEEEKHAADLARRAADASAKAETGAREKAQAAQKHAEEEKQAADLARQEADAARRKAEWLAYAGQIALAQREWQDGNVGHARALLDACQGNLRSWEHNYLYTLFNHLRQQTLRGHTGSVYSVAFSPDGKRLVSGSEDHTVKVWDAVTGQETLTLRGHSGPVYSVAFSPDGKRLLSGSARYYNGGRAADGEVKVWDAQTGHETLTLQGHTGAVHSVAFSPDGKRLASASTDQTVKVWEAQTGQLTLSLKGHTGPVYSVAFSPDGKRLVSGSGDRTVRLWDALTGQETLSHKGHTGRDHSVAFSPDGKRIASGSEDQTVRVWDAQTGENTLSLKGHTGGVNSVAFSPDSKRLVSASSDATLKVWDAQTGEQALSLKGHSFSVESVAFSPDDKHLLSGSLDKTLKMWDAQTGQQTLSLKGHTSEVSSLAVSPDGRRLLSGSSDKTLKMWDAQTGQLILTLQGHTGPVTSVAFSPDGKRLLSGRGWPTSPREPGEIMVWDAQTGQETLTIKGHNGGFLSVAFSPDGKRLLSGSRDGTVKVWDEQTGQETLTIKGHTSSVLSVAFSPDGKRLASASTDRTIKVWDVETGKETRTLKVFRGWIHSVAFSPDGKRLLCGSYDKTLTVWDAETGQETLILKGHTGPVLCVAFSPDGKRLVSGSQDKTLKVWDAQTGQETLSLQGHTGGVRGVAFSPDGKRLISGSEDGTLKVWDASYKFDEPAPEGAGPRK